MRHWPGKVNRFRLSAIRIADSGLDFMQCRSLEALDDDYAAAGLDGLQQQQSTSSVSFFARPAPSAATAAHLRPCTIHLRTAPLN